MKITEITIENLKNAKTGDVIVSPVEGEIVIEKFQYQINFYKNGKLFKRKYADQFVWYCYGTGAEAYVNAMLDRLVYELTHDPNYKYTYYRMP